MCRTEGEKECGSGGSFCGHCGGRLPPVCRCGYRQLEEENAYLIEHDKERERWYETKIASLRKQLAKEKEISRREELPVMTEQEIFEHNIKCKVVSTPCEDCAEKDKRIEELEKG